MRCWRAGDCRRVDVCGSCVRVIIYHILTFGYSSSIQKYIKVLRSGVHSFIIMRYRAGSATVARFLSAQQSEFLVAF
jgi:hypothetical protein